MKQDTAGHHTSHGAYSLPILVVLVIVAAALRSFIAYNGGLWRDEALFLSIVRLPSFGDVLQVLRLHESHPPLFYLLMRGWVSLAGDTDRAALLLPVLFGIALVPVMFVAGRQLYSARAGVIAAALTAIIPTLAEYSAEVRPYSLLPLLVVLSCWVLVVALNRTSLLLWSAYAASAIALVYTHNWTWVLVAGQFAATATVILRADRRRRSEVTVRSGAAFVVIGLAYLPWLPVLRYQAAHAGHPPHPFKNLSGMLLLIPNGFFRAIQSTLLPPVKTLQMLLLVAAGLVAASLFALVKRLSTNRAEITNESAGLISLRAAAGQDQEAMQANAVFLTVFLVATVLASVLSVHSDMMQARCLTMLAPLLVLLVAGRIDLVQNRTPPGSLGRRLIFATATVVALSYILRLDFLITIPRSNAREVAHAVDDATEASDLVIVEREWLASFNHYYRAPNAQIDFPSFGRPKLPDFADVWSRLEDPRALSRVQAEIIAAKEVGRRVWLVGDRQSLRPLSNKDLLDAERQGNYIALSNLRARQIKDMLVREYGPPVQAIKGIGTPSRYEEFHAFLFRPR